VWHPYRTTKASRILERQEAKIQERSEEIFTINYMYRLDQHVLHIVRKWGLPSLTVPAREGGENGLQAGANRHSKPR
jgi:hypothetical protein